MIADLAEVGAGLHALPGHPAAFAGRGASARLVELFDALDVRRCLVVRGRTSYERCGVAGALEAAGRGRVLEFVRAAPWQVSVAEVSAAIEVFTEFRPDTVLAVGGGSALDLAKAMTNLEPGELVPAITAGRVREREARLVLVPTTAGSGSELTGFATLWDGTTKLSLDAPGLRADVALVDPDLVGSAPPAVLVSAAADALSQSVESSWARSATEESRGWSAAAYRTLLPAVATGITRGSLAEPDLHEPLMLGASLAGAAINISRTTAAHALSYPVTARLGVPHGAAVAVFLPWLVEHNRPELPDRISNIDATAVELAGAPLAELMPALLDLAGFATRPDRLALDQPTRDELLAMTKSMRMQNNPRPVERADLLALLAGTA